MRHRGKIVAGLTGCVVVAGLALPGCSRADRYRMDPSPRIHTRAQSEQEIKNALTIVNDTNFRYFWNDMGRLFLMDRRSQLDPGPNW
jgi:hypothetical protein